MVKRRESRFTLKSSLTYSRSKELLENLMENEDFRTRFERNPRASLKKYGIDIGRNITLALPPKSACRRALRELEESRRHPPWFNFDFVFFVGRAFHRKPSPGKAQEAARKK